MLTRRIGIVGITLATVLSGAVTVLLALPEVVAAQQAGAAASADLDKILKAARASTGAPGVAVSIVRDGRVAWEGFDGLADVEHEVPVSARARFRLGSITKTMTGMAVMQMVEQGKVGLDDPIAKYVPYYPKERASVITVRHLLTHTSGIRHYHYETGEKEGNPPQYFASMKEAVLNMGSNGVAGSLPVAEEPLLFTPGTAFSYSTFGFRLLGEVLERASGVKWDAYVKEHVFDPAGMTLTLNEDPLAIIASRARGYRRNGLGNPREGIVRPWPAGAALINAPYVDFSYKEPAASILSTAGDLARYTIALNAGKVIKPATLAQVLTPYTLTNGKPAPQGLAWRVSTDGKGRKWVSHGGGATGFTASLQMAPESGFAIAIVTNVEGARLQDLTAKMIDAVLGAGTAPRNVAQPQEVGRRYSR